MGHDRPYPPERAAAAPNGRANGASGAPHEGGLTAGMQDVSQFREYPGSAGPVAVGEMRRPAKAPDRPPVPPRIGRRPLLIAATTVALAVALMAGAVQALAGALNGLGELGIPVSGEISASATESMIAANDVLRAVGPFFPPALLALLATLLWRRRSSARLDGAFGYVRATRDGHRHPLSPLRPNVALAAIIIGAIASASSLGDVAGDGANAPLREFLTSTLADPEDESALAVVSHERWTPFNYGLIEPGAADLVAEEATESSGEAVPFTLALDDINVARDGFTNPSSAPIVGIPAADLEQITGLEGAFTNAAAGCSDTGVIVGDQLGVGRGARVELMGRPATVAATVAIAPGLDRVFAAGSLEQLGECGLSGAERSGVLVAGVERDRLLGALAAGGHDHPVVELAELERNYSSFWDRNVKPVSMQLALLVLALGATGVAFARSNRILLERRAIATLNGLQVPKAALIRAETLRTVLTAGLATLYGAVVMTAMIYLAKTSQYGVQDLKPDVESLGAGLAAYALAAVVSSLAAAKRIRRMDTCAEMRAV